MIFNLSSPAILAVDIIGLYNVEATIPPNLKNKHSHVIHQTFSFYAQSMISQYQCILPLVGSSLAAHASVSPNSLETLATSPGHSLAGYVNIPVQSTVAIHDQGSAYTTGKEELKGSPTPAITGCQP